MLRSVLLLALLLPALAQADGGPDSYGYEWETTAYAPVTLDSSATTASFSSGVDAVSLPFTFTYYGVGYTTVYLRTDGSLGFRSAALTQPYCVPYQSSTSPDILAYHGPLTGGTVRYDSLESNSRFVVSYESVLHASGGNSVSFQIHLLSDNSIELHYVDTDHNEPTLDDGAAVAAGIQAATQGAAGGGYALSVSCSSPTLDSGDAIRFFACEDNDNDGVTTCEGDCNDNHGGIPYPWETACNGQDDDCNPLTVDQTDDDGDGFTACGGEDCNDGIPTTYPGAPELPCDGVDNDCDPATPDDLDADGDGVFLCQGDCDDGDASIFSGRPEGVCNGIDDDCDPLTSDTPDGDGDGETVCDGDCDDDNAAISSLLSEVACDGLDNDCDPSTVDGDDLDGDGFVGCADDCDDGDATVFPGAPELCDGLDNDCSGGTADTAWYAPIALTNLESVDAFRGLRFDVEADVPLREIEARIAMLATRDLEFGVYGSDTGEGTFTLEASSIVPHAGDGTPTWVAAPFDHVLVGGRTYVLGVGHVGTVDIRSVPVAVLPNATSFGSLTSGVELADWDGLMPGEVFTESAGTYAINLTLGGEDDPDGDGSLSCADCGPDDATVYPGAPELCDGADSDCDGSLDADELDEDGDGFTPCQSDCDDADPATSPAAAELCNGADDDCDSTIPPDETLDSDSDGSPSCADCDDGNSAVFPGAPEVCDTVDDDCDGLLQGATETFLDPPPAATEWAQGTFGVGIVPHAPRRLSEFRVRMKPLEAGTLVIGLWDIVFSTRWQATQTIELSPAPDGEFHWYSSGPLDVELEPNELYYLAFHYSEAFELAAGERDIPYLMEVPGRVSAVRYNTTETDPYSEMWTSSAGDVLYDFEVVYEDDLDVDGDGYLGCVDCADEDPAISPAAPELCNGHDDNCDGVLGVDEVNADNDFAWACDGDCDESNPATYPGAMELCDGEDNDCDGSLGADEADADGDGFRVCDDCDDADPALNNYTPEVCDGVDGNCDGSLALVHDPGPWTALDSDSSVMRANIFYATQDTTLEGLEVFASTIDYDYWSFEVYEADSVDGPWDTRLVRQFVPQPDSAPNWIDSGTLNLPIQAGKYYSFGWFTPPSGYDDHLIGRIDAPALPMDAGFGRLIGSHTASNSSNWYPTDYALSTDEVFQIRARWGTEQDVDGDGAPACAECDDTDNSFVPIAVPEFCDGVDTNCDGDLPEEEADVDGDGQIPCNGDCDDEDPNVYTGAPEICDGVDSDCDTVLGPDDELDTDGDGQVDCLDCDSADPLAYEGAPEVCDGADSDCDPNTDMPTQYGFSQYAYVEDVGPGAPGFYAIKWTPNLPMSLWDMHAYFGRAEDSAGDWIGLTVTWQLWSGPTEDGPWTLEHQEVEYSASPYTAASRASTGFISRTLQPGTYYVAGVHLDDAVTSVGTGGTDRPQSEAMGTLVGSVIVPGLTAPDGSPTFDTRTSAHPRVYFEILNEGSDLDGDGSDRCADCDSANPLRFPGNPEVCDGVDNDCDEELAVDEGTDADGDGQAPCEGDCDDTNPDTFFLATEVCDGLDNDCDLADASDELEDGDQDGFSCDDCDDADPAVHPDAVEVCNGVDDNCDGLEIDGFLTESNHSTTSDLGEFWNVWAWAFDPAEATALRAMAARLYSPSGTEVTFAVWETSASGSPITYTRILEETEIASGQWQTLWHTFEEDVDLDPAKQYLFGVYLPDPAALMRNYYSSQAPAPPTGAWAGRYQSDTFQTSWTHYNHNGNSSALSLLFAGERDPDADGWPECAQDCDNADPLTFPGAPEFCDGLDNDCDGDAEFAGELEDSDLDGSPACEDCDDLLPTVSPNVVEQCDGLDTDCDGLLGPDEVDSDGDGSTVCGGDCDDGDASRYIGAAEVCNGIDDDCDGVVPADESDADGDGFSTCAGDCDDGDASAAPDQGESCDGVDNDCDGVLPADESDADGDGHLPCGGDCDDSDAGVYTGAAEACDGVDNDCDGALPADELDGDGDGAVACADCDDADATRYDDAPELCDGIDNDCDNAVPSDEADDDGDGVRECAGDCNDGLASVFPGAPELCDGVDNDCDAGTDENVDGDADGYGACDECDDNDEDINPDAEEVCDTVDNDCDEDTDEEVDGDGDGLTICEDDCDDGNAAVFPGQPEVCNGIDDDCDDTTGESDDADGDGYTPCQGDCDDQRPGAYPGATEQCNGLDDNCDGAIIPLEMDADGDGFLPCDDDCDDTDANNHPDAVEDCFDGEDNDCDNAADAADSDCGGDDDDATGDDDDATGDDDDATGDDDDATGDDDDATGDDDDATGDDDDAVDDDDAGDDDDSADADCQCSSGGAAGWLLLPLLLMRRRRA